MKKSKKNGKKRGDTLGMVLIAILEALMLLLVAFLLLMVVRLRGQQAAATSVFVEQSVKPTKTVETENVVYDPNEAEVVPSPVITPQPTPEPTPEPTPTPTPEPQPEYFKLSFVGDNTLWATSNFENNPVGLPLTVGDDTSYPYKNTVKYFSEDEYTLANLECSFSDKKLGYDYTATTFPFLAKASYVNILLDGGVDFVTMCNNHALDFYHRVRHYRDIMRKLVIIDLSGNEDCLSLFETRKLAHFLLIGGLCEEFHHQRAAVVGDTVGYNGLVVAELLDLACEDISDNNYLFT